MPINCNHGALNRALNVTNDSDALIYVLVLEDMTGVNFKVEAWRERTSLSPVVFGGEVRINETANATVRALIDDPRFDFSIADLRGRYSADDTVDYTILEIILATSTTASLSDFQREEYDNFKYGVSQQTPAVREIISGSISIRQGV